MTGVILSRSGGGGCCEVIGIELVISTTVRVRFQSINMEA